ncbi:MAG: hypothetical protein HCA25_16575 [Dolichospermum sp. DET50]|nr:hypothetical protein [Dolichospermum sp. DET66]MBS3033842.1 hypothetical protein [Dolichospermum sp. DET67]MBS3039045.1 hypothetical protein [Dolichospermum sp. DET50]QSX66292.1 MAG: hypothetical protein EZY12_15835 [Dolichospermum sp. DET69]
MRSPRYCCADIVGFSTDAVYTALGQTNGTFGATMAATYEFLPTQGWNNFDQYPHLINLIIFGDFIDDN